jgi:hypothetical protein
VPPVWFKDYEVKIYTPSGKVRRTEFTEVPDYIYTFGKNSEDGLGIPVGTFKISVSARDRLGRVSGIPTSMTAINTDPDDVGEVESAVAVGGVSFSWPVNDDTDLKGYVYRTKVATLPFPTAWSKATSNRILCSLTISQVLAYGNKATIYIQVKAEDVFGNVSVVASEANALANYIADNLFQLSASTTGSGDPKLLYDGHTETTSGGVTI